MNASYSHVPPPQNRIGRRAPLFAMCVILGIPIGAFVWQYTHHHVTREIVEDPTNTQTTPLWTPPSVVAVMSEQDLQDQRCDIAQALLARLRTDEGGALDIVRNLKSVDGDVLEGSAEAAFQTPEAMWILTYSPSLREDTALVFYEIPKVGSSNAEVRDYGLDCMVDAGYLDGTATFDPTDEDSYEEIMFFSESEFQDDNTCGEHYRAHWQEELDHAYQVAAQAFGL